MVQVGGVVVLVLVEVLVVVRVVLVEDRPDRPRDVALLETARDQAGALPGGVLQHQHGCVVELHGDDSTHVAAAHG